MGSILLTGGTGFVGSHLLNDLLENGKEVILLKRLQSSMHRIDHLKSQFNSYDVETTDLKTIFKENKVKQIIHLATDYGRDNNFYRCNQSNVQFPLNLLQTGYDFGVSRFISTDTFSSLAKKLDYLPCLLYTSPSARDATLSRMPSSA